MSRENAFLMLQDLDDRYVTESILYAPEGVSGSPERIVRLKKKRIITFALAAALILSLSAVAYAAWSIHTARQQELKADLKIEESSVSSYVEYDVAEEQDGGLVLLSSVNDGQEQRVYVNISPVSEEEASAFAETLSFTWSIPGTDVGGFAAPQLPAGLTLSGQDEIREAVLTHAYDRETQTMTLQCYLDVNRVRAAMAELGTESIPLQVNMFHGDEPSRSFGPLQFSLTEEQRRTFDFGGVRYYDAELDKEIELVSLELTPFSAVWKVRYDAAEQFHQPNADWEAYKDWSILEDRVCIESSLIFSDGSRFSTGGVLAAPIENGIVNLQCSWGAAIDIDDIQRIVLGDLVLWEAQH